MTLHRITAAATAVCAIIVLAGCPHPKPRHAASRRHVAETLGWSIDDFTAGRVRVLYKRSPGKQVVAVRIYFDGGTRNLTADDAGIEELTLSTMELGGSTNHPLDDMNRRLAANGIQLYTAAGQDYSVVAIKAPRPAFETAWNLLVDLVLHPNLGGIALEVQRRRQLAAIASRYDSPDQAVTLLQEERFFAGHPYATRQIGTPRNIKRFTAKDLQAYHRRLLDPARMLVVITGDMDPKQVRSLANAAFGGLESSGTPPAAMPPTPKHPADLTYVARDLPTSYVLAYFPAPKPGHPDWAAWKVATAWLSEELFNELRTKNKLCYAVSSDLSVRQANVGYIYLSSTQPKRALELTMATIHRLAREGISPAKLESLRRVHATEYLLGLQTQSAQARLLARAALTAGDPRWALRSPGEIEAVTRTDIQKALTKIAQTLRVLVLGPTPVSQSVLKR